jgi:hypothetical protein
MGPAYAIKVWNSSETILVADLNSNFSTVNTAATALVTNAKVDANAAIAHTKLATPSLVPKAWAVVANCTADPCTKNEGTSKIGSVNWTSTGIMTVNLSGTWANAYVGVLITPINAADRQCWATSTSTTTIGVKCMDLAGVVQNSGFSILVMDVDTVL